MSSNLIETAKDLSEVMEDLYDELLFDLESAGKRGLFEEAIQHLIAQADAVQSEEDLNALAQNIYRLVSETKELQDLLPDELPNNDPQLGFDESTRAEGEALEAKHQERLKATAGIKQHLVVLVTDVEPPQTDDPQSQFDKILNKLGLQRK